MRQGPLPRLGRLFLLAFLASRCFSCIPEDEFLCEDAAQRLESCCGQLPVRRCVYEESTERVGGGCSGKPLVITKRYEDPELMGRDAACLGGKDCDAVRSAGACRASSWLLPPDCSTYKETLPGGQEVYHRRCTSPPQDLTCERARPLEACEALRRLRCR